jgi:ribosomal protein L7/L12
MRFLFWEISCRFVGLKKSLDRRLIDLIEEGKLISAIKLYREETNSGLMKSKAHIDTLAAKIKPKRNDE